MISSRSAYRLLLVSLTAVTVVLQAAPARAAGPAGHWHVTTSIRCVSNGYNLAACQQIAGSQFAAFSVQGAVLAMHSSSEYSVDAHGRFTGHGSTTLTERVMGYGALASCAPDQIVNVAWTGTCYTAWSGRGHIAPGKTGMSDFWLEIGTTTIHGPGPLKPHRVSFHLLNDSRIPAVAGVYSTTRYFRFLHLTPVRGVFVRTVVTHVP